MCRWCYVSCVCVQIVLLGTDDGLFALNPQSTSGRQHLVQLSGFGSVHQIAEAKGINMVLLLTGTAYASVTFLFSSFPSCLPAFFLSFLPSFPSFPSLLPSFPSLLPSFVLPSFSPSFLPAFVPCCFSFPLSLIVLFFQSFLWSCFQVYLLSLEMVSHANHIFF